MRVKNEAIKDLYLLAQELDLWRVPKNMSVFQKLLGFILRHTKQFHETSPFPQNDFEEYVRCGICSALDILLEVKYITQDISTQTCTDNNNNKNQKHEYFMGETATTTKSEKRVKQETEMDEGLDWSDVSSVDSLRSYDADFYEYQENEYKTCFSGGEMGEIICRREKTHLHVSAKKDVQSFIYANSVFRQEIIQQQNYIHRIGDILDICEEEKYRQQTTTKQQSTFQGSKQRHHHGSFMWVSTLFFTLQRLLEDKRIGQYNRPKNTSQPPKNQLLHNNNKKNKSNIFSSSNKETNNNTNNLDKTNPFFLSAFIATIFAHVSNFEDAFKFVIEIPTKLLGGISLFQNEVDENILFTEYICNTVFLRHISKIQNYDCGSDQQSSSTTNVFTKTKTLEEILKIMSTHQSFNVYKKKVNASLETPHDVAFRRGHWFNHFEPMIFTIIDKLIRSNHFQGKDPLQNIFCDHDKQRSTPQKICYVMETPRINGILFANMVLQNNLSMNENDCMGFAPLSKSVWSSDGCHRLQELCVLLLKSLDAPPSSKKTCFLDTISFLSIPLSILVPITVVTNNDDKSVVNTEIIGNEEEIKYQSIPVFGVTELICLVSGLFTECFRESHYFLDDTMKSELNEVNHLCVLPPKHVLCDGGETEKSFRNSFLHKNVSCLQKFQSRFFQKLNKHIQRAIRGRILNLKVIQNLCSQKQNLLYESQDLSALLLLVGKKNNLLFWNPFFGIMNSREHVEVWVSSLMNSLIGLIDFFESHLFSHSKHIVCPLLCQKSSHKLHKAIHIHCQEKTRLHESLTPLRHDNEIKQINTVVHPINYLANVLCGLVGLEHKLQNAHPFYDDTKEAINVESMITMDHECVRNKILQQVSFGGGSCRTMTHVSFVNIRIQSASEIGKKLFALLETTSTSHCEIVEKSVGVDGPPLQQKETTTVIPKQEKTLSGNYLIFRAKLTTSFIEIDEAINGDDMCKCNSSNANMCDSCQLLRAESIGNLILQGITIHVPIGLLTNHHMFQPFEKRSGEKAYAYLEEYFDPHALYTSFLEMRSDETPKQDSFLFVLMMQTIAGVIALKQFAHILVGDLCLNVSCIEGCVNSTIQCRRVLPGGVWVYKLGSRGTELICPNMGHLWVIANHALTHGIPTKLLSKSQMFIMQNRIIAQFLTSIIEIGIKKRKCISASVAFAKILLEFMKLLNDDTIDHTDGNKEKEEEITIIKTKSNNINQEMMIVKKANKNQAKSLDRRVFVEMDLSDCQYLHNDKMQILYTQELRLQSTAPIALSELSSAPVLVWITIPSIKTILKPVILESDVSQQRNKKIYYVVSMHDLFLVLGKTIMTHFLGTSSSNNNNILNNQFHMTEYNMNPNSHHGATCAFPL